MTETKSTKGMICTTVETEKEYEKLILIQAGKDTTVTISGIGGIVAVYAESEEKQEKRPGIKGVMLAQGMYLVDEFSDEMQDGELYENTGGPYGLSMLFSGTSPIQNGED